MATLIPGLIQGAEVVTIAVLKLIGNDDSRPPIPKPGEFPDYTAQFQKLDPSKPVGIFIFAVDHKGAPGLFGDFAVNVSRNNFIAEMRKHYGQNVIIVDNPAGFGTELRQVAHNHLENFVTQFNAHFVNQAPQVHVVANHHQSQYDDAFFADQLARVRGTNKRALMLSCGPKSAPYRNMLGFDAIVIPRPDGQILGPELDIYPSPAYRYVIGWMRNEPSAEAIQKRFDSWFDFDHIGSATRDWLVQKATHVGSLAMGINIPASYQPPMVLAGVAAMPTDLGRFDSPPLHSPKPSGDGRPLPK